MSDAVATCEHVSVVYGTGAAEIHALRDVSLTIGAGETVALWGRSGSGKTTLLHVLGGLVAPTEGRATFGGRPSYVFQAANLLPHFTAEENVAFALRAAGADAAWDLPPADLLTLVGLSAKRDALPGELSGGEAQRVAIARALAQTPALLLCDEPTGHLDRDTGERVLGLIEACRQELGFGLVTATHDAEVAARSERRVELLDGRVVRDAVAA